jgi:hypothetical protein
MTPLGPDDPTLKIRSPSGELRALGHSLEAIDSIRPRVVNAVLDAINEVRSRRVIGSPKPDPEVERYAIASVAADNLRAVMVDAVLETLNPPRAVVPVAEDDGASDDPRLREAWNMAMGMCRMTATSTSLPTSFDVRAVLVRKHNVVVSRAEVIAACKRAGLSLADAHSEEP